MLGVSRVYEVTNISACEQRLLGAKQAGSHGAHQTATSTRAHAATTHWNKSESSQQTEVRSRLPAPKASETKH